MAAVAIVVSKGEAGGRHCWAMPGTASSPGEVGVEKKRKRRSKDKKKVLTSAGMALWQRVVVDAGAREGYCRGRSWTWEATVVIKLY